jgi:predicted N-acetyltransferase YhbS
MFIRAADERDLDRLIEIHTASYPDDRSHDARRRNFVHNPLGSLTDLRVVEAEGQIVGHGFVFAVEIWLGGKLVPAGGIASVAVAPEARRQGIASKLIAAMHDELRARGAALALLYPFRHGFYARLGYATTSPLVHVRIASRSLAQTLDVASAREEVAPSGKRIPSRLVALGGDRANDIRRAYERAARNASGWLGRDDARFQRLLSDERRVWLGAVDEVGSLEGYVSWSYDMPKLHGTTTAIVHELVADSTRVRRELLRAIALQGDQIDHVRSSTSSARCSAAGTPRMATSCSPSSTTVERGPCDSSCKRGARSCSRERTVMRSSSDARRWPAFVHRASCRAKRLPSSSPAAHTLRRSSGPIDCSLAGDSVVWTPSS